MKAIVTPSIVLLLFTTTALPSPTLGFVSATGNQVCAAAHSKTKLTVQKIMRDDIAKELQHLGTEIKNHILHTQPPDAAAANSVVDEGDTSSEPHSHLVVVDEESIIHKLRDEMRERDAQYRSMLQGIQDAVAGK
jgi:hypothetical protein